MPSCLRRPLYKIRLAGVALCLLSLWQAVAPAETAAQSAVHPEDVRLDAILARYGSDILLDPEKRREPPDPGLVKLGRELFFSKSLSGNMDVSCASCHHPFLAGGDKLSLPVGESAYDPDLLGPGRWHDWRASGDPKANGAPNVPRHSPTIFNSALYQRVMFFDGRLFLLEPEGPDAGTAERHRTPDSVLLQPDPRAGRSILASQARFPVVSLQEMQGFHFGAGWSHEEVRNALIDRLRGTSGELVGNAWLTWFREAFQAPGGTAEELITFENLQDALAAYQASQIFVDNDWHAYLSGDASRLDQEQRRGAALFFMSPEEGGAGCAVCHKPPIFSDEAFHNIAVPQFGRGIQADGHDFGRRGVTQREEDRFRFRTPSLLNVARTAPYGHTGAFLSLREVLEHHLDPERSISRFDFSFQNNDQLRHVADIYANAEALTAAALEDLKRKQSLGQSALPQGLSLSDADVDALESFLHALTDPCLDDHACLSRSLPDENVPSPDGHRQVARFGYHGPPPSSIATDTGVDGEPWSGRIAPTAGTARPVMRNDCAHGMPGANAGGFVFEEVGLQAGLTARHEVSWELYRIDTAQRVVFTGGVAAGDVDGDCWADIYYPTGDTTADVLYRNTGDGRFEDVSQAWGIVQTDFSNGAAMADLDGDGHLDVITTNILHPEKPSILGQAVGAERSQAPTVYRNEGGKRFSVWTGLDIAADFTSWSFSFGDYDADGDLDALSTHWRGPGLGGAQPNHLWKNNGAGEGKAFTPEDRRANLLDMVGKTDFTFTGVFSDFNLDGWPDILMASDFESSQVYKNLGETGFARVTEASEITDENGMGAAVADYDNDGDLDWFVSSIWDPNGFAEGTWGVTGNRLYRNDRGRFVDATDEAGVAEGHWGWGACFADFNNDAWPDLFHVNGFDLHAKIARHLGAPRVFVSLRRSMLEFEKTPSRLFISNRNGSFKERSEAWGITDTKSGRGVVCFDYDRDGDVDILVSNHQDRLLLYRNNARSMPDTNFINISLRGLDKNTGAIGARVYVTANGVTQLQEMRAGGSFLASPPQELHFGLGSADIIERIEVVWPRPNYKNNVLTDVAVNQFVTIEQPADN